MRNEAVWLEFDLEVYTMSKFLSRYDVLKLKDKMLSYRSPLNKRDTTVPFSAKDLLQYCNFTFLLDSVKR